MLSAAARTLPCRQRCDLYCLALHGRAVRTFSVQIRGATPPASSQMECTVAPSPFVRLGSEQSAWQRAARQLNTVLNGALLQPASSCLSSSGSQLSLYPCDSANLPATLPNRRLVLKGSWVTGYCTAGSDEETAPSCKRARSAEAESPSSTHQLYALRSRTKPPPGFGENPDPAAEKAAREAHAMTSGPLKKRLKVRFCTALQPPHMPRIVSESLQLASGSCQSSGDGRDSSKYRK